MRKRLLFALATAALLAAGGAHARTAYCDGDAPTVGCPGYTAPTTAKPVGPLYIFGTHNTMPTVLVYDTAGAQLCSPNLTNCRPAYGLDALRRGTEFAVSQMLRWDRSGVFAVNTNEIIACFQYFDGPGAANFNCATAPRGGLKGYELSVAATALGWRTYSGAGLAPLSAARAGALFATRKRVRAYTVAYGTLPTDRMHALDEEAPINVDSGGDTTYWERNVDPDMSEQELEEVVVVGRRDEIGIPSIEVSSTPPNTSFPPSVIVAGPGTPREREIIINPCVSFQACAAPPAPPPPEFPKDKPKVCTPQCNETGAIMSATCGATAGQLATTFGVLAPTAGIIAGVVGDPLFGYVVFRSIGVIGTGTTAAYGVACISLNEFYKSQCLQQAKANGC